MATINGNLQFLGLGQLQNARFENLATDPSSPAAGQVWFNTTSNQLKGFDGTSIFTIASGGSTGAIQSELDAVETSVGLNADGTFTAPTGTNYLGSITTVMGGLEALDTQVKTNTTNIATNATAISTETTNRTTAVSNLQTEVDAIETSVGLNSDGTFTAPTGTNFLGSITSIVGGLKALDTQIETNVTAIATKVSKSGDSLTGNLTFGGTATVTGLAAPSNATDAATKNYVDAALSGLTWLKPVKQVLADKTTYANALVVGDRLVDTTDNKIYTVTGAGANGAAATFDAGVAPVNADAVFTTDDETGYVFSGSAWVQFTGTGQIAAGVGLQKSGNTLSVQLGAGIAQLPTNEVGVDVYATGGLFLTDDGSTSSTDAASQLAIKLDGTTLATGTNGLKVKAGGITATEIAASAVGSGLTGGAGTAVSVSVGTGIVLTSGAVTLDETVTDARYVKKAGDTMTGLLVLSADPTAALGAATKQYVDAVSTKLANGYFLYTAGAAATSHTVTHNMGNKYANVTVVDASDAVIIPQSIVFDDVNSLTVTFNTAITCKVVVSGLAA
jgi:hypothetical protein